MIQIITLERQSRGQQKLPLIHALVALLLAARKPYEHALILSAIHNSRSRAIQMLRKRDGEKKEVLVQTAHLEHHAIVETVIPVRGALGNTRMRQKDIRTRARVDRDQ